MWDYTSLNISTEISNEQKFRSLDLQCLVLLHILLLRTVFNSGLAAVSRELESPTCCRPPNTILTKIRTTDCCFNTSNVCFSYATCQFFGSMVLTTMSVIKRWHLQGGHTDVSVWVSHIKAFINAICQTEKAAVTQTRADNHPLRQHVVQLE